ncbi:tRNA(Arg) A34 adenosine deaminase TadA [Streptomyces sp. DI166]|nr:tRNA(Arg) A34 adenosine deaminase TadA [Streptomyces sp. DI166]
MTISESGRNRPDPQNEEISAADMTHLRRCVELAQEAWHAGDFPFGSVLVASDGTVLAEERNREVTTADETRHPEFELARWAAAHLTAQERRDATVYTSGEHCPMCAAAHAWVGLGRIVYAASSEQLASWRAGMGIAPSPVKPLPITAIAPGVIVAGPVPELEEPMRELHHRIRRSSFQSGQEQ